MRITRRQIIMGLLGAGALRHTHGIFTSRALAATRRKFAPVFESDRQQVLAAAAERILPGAVAAGFEDYLNYWMARPPLSEAPDWKPLLNIGAVHLERIAKKQHKRSFYDCSAEQQDAILKSFQQGKVTAKRFKSSSFYQRLVMLTLESFLSDPKYGGNRDMIGFKFIGRRHQCWWAPKSILHHVNPQPGAGK